MASRDRATVIGLLKNWPVKFRPVIFGLLLYANEIWRHIYQIWKNITGQWIIEHFLPGVTAFDAEAEKLNRINQQKFNLELSKYFIGLSMLDKQGFEFLIVP